MKDHLIASLTVIVHSAISTPSDSRATSTLPNLTLANLTLPPLKM
jgi:hypothetical protein